MKDVMKEQFPQTIGFLFAERGCLEETVTWHWCTLERFEVVLLKEIRKSGLS